MKHEVLAVTMTLIAGLSTGIGGLITYFSKKPNARFLSVSLGFSAGVMIYVSMVELFAESKDTLTAALGSGGYALAGPLILRGNARHRSHRSAGSGVRKSP